MPKFGGGQQVTFRWPCGDLAHPLPRKKKRPPHCPFFLRQQTRVDSPDCPAMACCCAFRSSFRIRAQSHETRIWGLFFAMEKTTVVIFSELTAILLKSKQSPSVFKDLNFALGDFEALSCQDQTYQAQHHGGTQQEPTCPGDTSRVSGCQEVNQS